MLSVTWQKISQESIQALKSRNSELLAILRLLQSALKNAEIEKMSPLEEVDVIAVLKKEVKRRRDSASQYTQAGRLDLAEKENAEIVFIEPYLPAQMDDILLMSEIKVVLAEISEDKRKDFGVVMRAAKEKIGDRADGKRVADAVKKILQ